MDLSIAFFLTNIGLGVGLAMDAFSVSLANGLNEPCMKKSRACGIAGVFGILQGLMPLIGWICVHTIVDYFNGLKFLIPWIALGLLVFIGGKMLIEGIKGGEEDCCAKPGLTFMAILVQGIATSIDALSVGFTIAEYGLLEALLAVLLIAVITFIICLFGIEIGKKAGVRFAGKAEIIGGIILILIGIEIFVTSFI